MCPDTPDSVFVHEVAPRDGLQNENTVLGASIRANFVEQLALAKPSSLEAVAFVHPKKVPQMADPMGVAHALAEADFRPEIPLFALIPNERGFARFRESGLDGITALVSCTESHSQANVGQSMDHALAECCRLIDLAKQEGIPVRAYASMAFDCPFEGQTDTGRVGAVLDAFAGHSADVVLLADTLGRGDVARVQELTHRALDSVSLESLGCHFHDTFNHAGDNIRAALDMGVRHFDTSAGGMGGCPFAPGAAGNYSTESLIELLNSLGYSHNMNAESLAAAVAAVREFLI